MARISQQPRGARRRPHGQLLAEVALVAVLLVGLVLAWPASPPTQPPPEVAVTVPLHPAALRDPSQAREEDDLSPSRTLPWRTPIAMSPPLYSPPPASAPPAQLFISSLNLHPVVESVGVDRSGAMSVPRNYFDVGWYNLGAVPGDPGDAVLDGHVGYPDQPLVFSKLGKMRYGDGIVVVLADGSRRAFSVVSVKSWPWWAHPTGLFQADGPARLTLITCAGKFNDKTFAYADRLVVEARYAGPGG